MRAYASATEFLDAVSTLRVGCVLTDVQMPGLNGLELQRRLIQLGIRLPVIVMTGHGDVPIAVDSESGSLDAGGIMVTRPITRTFSTVCKSRLRDFASATHSRSSNSVAVPKWASMSS